MKRFRDLPLLAKVLGWLSLHLLLLALAFLSFVGWQLGMGLDSLLSGSAGERLANFGEDALEAMTDLRPSQWDPAIAPLAEKRGVVAAIYQPGGETAFPVPVPANVVDRTRKFPRLRLREPGPPMPGDRPPLRGGMGPDGRLAREMLPPPDGEKRRPPSKPLFLMRGDGGDGYWAGIELTLPRPSGRPMTPELLLVRSDRLDGGGMFFDFKPWLLGGLGVLILSVAIWTPFVWRITRYLKKLTGSTERIAAGDFKISLPPRGADELGNLGQAIESMADRLDHLVAGQKRFLGDAAHELCAPLARLRTGVGILEMKLGDESRRHLAGIESEAEELAMLVEEILAFSRAGTRMALREPINLKQLVAGSIARETSAAIVENRVSDDLEIRSDARLLGRSIGNLLRNAVVHGGVGVRIVVEAESTPDEAEITVSDNGPGVAPDELPHLFEPFYRPDRSRSRDTGGSGLGLSIVRTAMDACGGKANATLPAEGGFRVTLKIPRKSA